MSASISGVKSNLPTAGSAEVGQVNKAVDQAASFEKALEKAKNSKDDVALKKVCEDFETVFVKMMMDTMKKANSIGSEDGLVEKSQGREIFEGMLDDELSKKVAQGGGIGIAKIMYSQLKKYTQEDNPQATLDEKK